MSNLNSPNTNELRNKIATVYNLDEMKTLCQDLYVNWEDIGVAETRAMFAQEIVNYFERHGQLEELIEQVRAKRSHLFYSSENQEIAIASHQNEFYNTSVHNDDGGNILWMYLIAVVIVAAYFLLSSWISDEKQKEPSIFVSNYISLLDNNSLNSLPNAWEKLSGDYRINKHPTGYTFSQYYRAYKNIEILEETDTMASVRVFLALTDFDNSVANQDIIYKLTRPTANDNWLIMDSNP